MCDRENNFMRRIALLFALLGGASGRLLGVGFPRRPSTRGTPRGAPDDAPKPVAIRPAVVGSSHNVTGYAPERAADGDESTFWMVPGGQRMEMMSRDKWLVLDLGERRPVSGLSLLGIVGSFAPARVHLQAGESPSGPWRRVCCFRALGSPMQWQHVELPPNVAEPSRFYRLFVRREGHATFKHQVHGVLFHAPPSELDQGAGP